MACLYALGTFIRSIIYKMLKEQIFFMAFAHMLNQFWYKTYCINSVIMIIPCPRDSDLPLNTNILHQCRELYSHFVSRHIYQNPDIHVWQTHIQSLKIHGHCPRDSRFPFNTFYPPSMLYAISMNLRHIQAHAVEQVYVNNVPWDSSDTWPLKPVGIASKQW